MLAFREVGEANLNLDGSDGRWCVDLIHAALLIIPLAAIYPRSRIHISYTGIRRKAGTASLKLALEILLNEPCYHMYEVFQDASRGKEWQRIYKEIQAGNDYPGFDNVFKGYGAAVDAPASEVWPWILKQYPDIKVCEPCFRIHSSTDNDGIPHTAGHPYSPPW